MTTNNSILWKTDQEYIGLVNFLIEKTKNVKRPLKISQLVSEFKEKSKSSLSEISLWHRIESFCPIVHVMDDVDVDTKVRLLFALSVPIDSYYLEELKTQAEIVLDDHRKITKYRKNGGGLTLGGTRIVKYKRKRRGGLQLRKTHIRINGCDKAIERDRKMLEFFAQKAMNVNSPIIVKAFLREFKEITRATKNIRHLENRFKLLKNKFHESKGFDQETKIRMLFVSSASVPNCFLEILRKDALVDVDEKNRITKYRANDGNLELQGDHSRSAKNRAVRREMGHCYLKQIINYFENKNEKNEEMSNFIKFITEKCLNVESPLSSHRLAKDFKSSYGSSKSLDTSRDRIVAYRREIQKLEYLDTPTKVKQLFVLSAPLNIDFLNGLRKEALVEVDDQNRITKYMANDGSLALEGDHSQSAKVKREWLEKRRNKNNEKEKKEGLEDEKYLDELEDYNNRSTCPDNSEKKPTIVTAINRRKSKKTNLDIIERDEEVNDIVDSDISSGKFVVSRKVNKETMKNKTEKVAEKIAPVKTRYGRLSKRSHLDSEFSYDLTNFNKNPEHSKSAKKKKANSSSRMPGPVDSTISEEPNDFQVKLEPFREPLIDGFAPLNPENGIQVIPAPKLGGPKKEIEEKISIKIEDDFIIPKQEDLEEEEEFKQAFNVTGDDFKIMPSLELCEPKKEVKEEAPSALASDIEMIKFPIKMEEDFIIPKLEEPEEEEEEDSLPK